MVPLEYRPPASLPLKSGNTGFMNHDFWFIFSSGILFYTFSMNRKTSWLLFPLILFASAIVYAADEQTDEDSPFVTNAPSAEELQGAEESPLNWIRYRLSAQTWNSGRKSLYVLFARLMAHPVVSDTKTGINGSVGWRNPPAPVSTTWVVHVMAISGPCVRIR